MDPGLPQPCPGRARDRHRRPARAGPRDPAGAGRRGSGTVADPRSGEPAPKAAWRLLDDPLATRTTLADLLEQCWQLLIAPHWPRLRDLLQADMLYRTQTQGDYGLERVLGELHPKARWTGHSLIIDAPATEEHQLARRRAAAHAQRVRLAGAGHRHRPAGPAGAHLPCQGNRRAVAARSHHALPSAQPPARPDPGRPARITRRTGLHPHPGPAARTCPQHRLRTPGHPPSRAPDHPQAPPPHRPLPAGPTRSGTRPRARDPCRAGLSTTLPSTRWRRSATRCGWRSPSSASTSC